MSSELGAKMSTIFARAGLPAPLSITPLPGGEVNPAFRVDDRYVVRFNVGDPEDRKFKREEIAYGLLRGNPGVPVPPVILLDESREAVPADVLVTGLLPGTSVASHWSSLPDPARQVLAARALAAIHAVEVPAFGPLEATAAPRWSEYLRQRAKRDLHSAIALGVFAGERGLEERLARVFRKLEPALAQVTVPRLVHGDFHFGNVLAIGERITGIVDFEWALGGDPDLDFRNITDRRDTADTGEEPWRATYRAATGRTPEPEKIELYRLLSKLELLSVSAKHWVGKVPWGERGHRICSRPFTPPSRAWSAGTGTGKVEFWSGRP